MLLLFALSQVVGEAGPQPTLSASPDWSKGLPIGISVLNNQVGMEIDEGGHIFLVWVDLEKKLHWMELDNQGRAVRDSTLDLELNSPLRPQIRRGPQGSFHLIWLDWREGKDRLFYIRLDKEGRVLSEPTIISSPEVRVERAQLAVNPQGGVEVFWTGIAAGEYGLYYSSLDSERKITRPSRLLLTAVRESTVGIDARGGIHLAWIASPSYNLREVWYGYLPPRGEALEKTTLLYSLNLVTQAGHFLGQPSVGLDLEYGYVFWQVEQRGRASVSNLRYAQFSLDNPADFVVQKLLIPSSIEQVEYQPYAGALGFHNLALPAGSALGPSGHLGEPQVMSGQGPELAVAFSMLPQEENLGRLRVAVAFFGNGQLLGYQVVNTPRGASLKPNLLADREGDLHLAWLETRGFDEYLVFYASTDPTVKAALSPITLREVTDWVLGALTSLSLVLLYLPLFFAWLVLPFFGLVVFYLIAGEGDLAKARAKVALAVASILYLLAVIVYPPSREGSLWGEATLATITGGIALGIVALYLWRVQIRSLFLTFLVFAFSQGFLRLAFHILSSQGYL